MGPNALPGGSSGGSPVGPVGPVGVRWDPPSEERASSGERRTRFERWERSVGTDRLLIGLGDRPGFETGRADLIRRSQKNVLPRSTEYYREVDRPLSAVESEGRTPGREASRQALSVCEHLNSRRQDRSHETTSHETNTQHAHTRSEHTHSRTRGRTVAFARENLAMDPGPRRYVTVLFTKAEPLQY